jgi:hypothetical protein
MVATGSAIAADDIVKVITAAAAITRYVPGFLEPKEIAI